MPQRDLSGSARPISWLGVMLFLLLVVLGWPYGYSVGYLAAALIIWSGTNLMVHAMKQNL